MVDKADLAMGSALAGGAIDVVAVPEGGTRISARIPLAAFR